MEKSGTAIGIRCTDGVVLGVEKSIVSKMLVPGSNRRIASINMSTGMCICGMAADGRQLVNKGREEAASYKSLYGVDISAQQLTDRVAGTVHMHTLYWYLRPFGCSALIAGYGGDKDDDVKAAEGPVLYCIDPSGLSYKYYAYAVGKNNKGAATELEKINFENITCREAVDLIAHIIYKLHDENKDKDFELEVTWVCDESKRRHQLVPKKLLDEAVKKAKEAKLKAEMESDSDSDE